MPVSLLIALFLAFGTDAVLPMAPVSREAILPRVVETLVVIGLVGLTALVIGLAVAIRVRRQGRASRGSRRLFSLGTRVVEILTLGGYAWIIHGLSWPEVVRSGLGLRDSILADEMLILIPYLLTLVVGWWGLYPGEKALRPEGLSDRPEPGVFRYLVLRARQTLGLVLPSALIFSLGQDVARRAWPSVAEEAGFQVAMMAGMGALVLALAPAFVRLSWPTRTLPPGPLRDRLERLATRFGFRFTDILIWDTDGAIVNAGVTGALPWFRYVLLTDALLEGLDPHEVAAVFGHEVGHVRHRHLGFFGFFFVGSMGVLTLASDLIYDHLLQGVGGPDGSTPAMVAQGGFALLLGVGYFAWIFGILSRRFERQADVFGCRAVSCDRVDCPPHPDLYSREFEASPGGPICPVGIRIFVNALNNVAALNGMEPTARSWRHGSITRRVAFLEGLEGRPEAERRFQAGVSRLRLGLALALVAAMVLAFRTGAIEHLGP
ncbi:M48 family metallopeptidase [Tundrisphaera lichenicola]|uniref:M48 family metallopeptidase n=1 Tax=Tundrisphaera lichenicola TaxID=2029860 RepID=UPI003EC14413